MNENPSCAPFTGAKPDCDPVQGKETNEPRVRQPIGKIRSEQRLQRPRQTPKIAELRSPSDTGEGIASVCREYAAFTTPAAVAIPDVSTAKGRQQVTWNRPIFFPCASLKVRIACGVG